MIILICPNCDSHELNYVEDEIDGEDSFECEDCGMVFPFYKMGWKYD